MRSLQESSLRFLGRCAIWCIEGAWLSMQAVILAVWLVLVGVWLTGCGRTVLVSEGSPVRLGPGTKAKIYFLDPITGEWTLSDNCVELDEGWYLVPPSFVEEGK